MPFRLIALDLDGTTIDGHGAIRPRTREALGEARRRGFEVVLVTGRHHAMARPYHRELDLTTPIVCCNGTYIYDFLADRTERGVPMTAEAAAAVVELAGGLGVDLLLYTDTVLYYETRTAHIDKLIAWIDRIDAATRPDFRHAGDYRAILAAAPPVWKFVATGADAGRLRRCHDGLRADGRFDVEYSWHDRVDVMPLGASKGARLLEWATDAGYDPSEIVAFGDNFNDLDMLRRVGHGIAMGNAPDEVKAGASETIGDNDSDAIADTVMRLIA
jgi:Cof subfamily protein (haloacid dehalogenase superfamily)